MFKTEEYIEKFAKLLTDQMEMENYTKEQVCIAIEEVLKDFQKDLLESASEGADEWFLNHNWKPEELMSRQAGCRVAWQSAKLSSKAQIDTLKQRELEYQSDLREKDRIINEKSNQIIEITKELQEKDERIRELERKIKSID